jgi:tetraacyldisaccharide 4'-kinase
VKFLLKPPELAYRGVTRLRRALYRAGVLKSKKLPRPVISIGNISFGGSGKTPLVIAIASELLQRGYGVAVLTRGYRRSGPEQFAVVTDNDAARFGDEAVVIARSVPGASVIVGADRYSAGLRFLEQADCDLFLLDDGFQHLQLARDLDIVIDDRASSLLREGRSALADADLVVHRDGEGFRLTVESATVVVQGQERPPDSLRNVKVLAFAGLANNARFFESCRKAGVELVATREFRDHHHYTRDDLELLRRAANACGAELLLTTEKDAVKITDPGVAYLRVRAEIEPHQAFFERVIEAIRSGTGDR